MKTTQTKIIKYKIFAKNDVKRLWCVVQKEYNESRRQKNHTVIGLAISCVNGLKYESETDDLLQDGDIIDTKKCTGLSIEYHDFKLERRISLSLEHGDGTYNNVLIVSGDKNWVAGTFEELNGLIDAVKPQDSLLVKYKTIILHAGAVLTGFLIFRVLDFVLYSKLKPIENPPEKLGIIIDFLNSSPIFICVFLVLAFWAMGIFPFLALENWVLKLYPSIEFDFGPEHKKVEKRKRNRIWFFCLIFVIPLIVTAVYDYFI